MTYDPGGEKHIHSEGKHLNPCKSFSETRVRGFGGVRNVTGNGCSFHFVLKRTKLESFPFLNVDGRKTLKQLNYSVGLKKTKTSWMHHNSPSQFFTDRYVGYFWLFLVSWSTNTLVHISCHIYLITPLW